MDKDPRLRVAETTSRLVGRGIAVIDPKVMDALELSAGDVIEISAMGKKSYAVLWTAYREDYGKGLIRIDGYARNNIGLGIDDTVSISQAESGPGGDLQITMREFEEAIREARRKSPRETRERLEIR